LHTFTSRTYVPHRDPTSFPTRRSSDLGAAAIADIILDHDGAKFGTEQGTSRAHIQAASIGAVLADIRRHQPTESISIRRRGIGRSEEHTSELQSRFDLVCRLLLEK